RLPGELAVRGLQTSRKRVPGEVFRDAEGRRHQASFRASGTLRARRVGSRLLEQGAVDDREPHRRTRSDGRLTPADRGGYGLTNGVKVVCRPGWPGIALC